MRLQPAAALVTALLLGMPAAARPPAGPLALFPCARPEGWQFSVRSKRLPLLVHYQKLNQEPVARAALASLERYWQFEVRELGFPPPKTDGGTCGPDEAYDVWLWRGHSEAYTTYVAENPSTPWADAYTTIVLDPWGPFGREFFASTLSHELNHAMQATQDWWEPSSIFEMTAQFVEWLAAGNDEVYLDVLGDFQARPDWSVDYNDDYATYYMYGAALYFHYLRDRHFGGQARFLAQLWRLSRSPPGADLDQRANEPDFEDALDTILSQLPEPLRYVDTIPEFARWRWYTGRHDDGRHFQGGLEMPSPALAAKLRFGQKPRMLEISPMLLGSAYVSLRRGTGGPSHVSVALEAPPEAGVRWVVQAMPGLEPGSDGEILDLSGGSASVRFTAAGARTLVFTALGDVDPDDRDRVPARRYPARVVVRPLY